jgi:hypothetical protein
MEDTGHGKALSTELNRLSEIAARDLLHRSNPSEKLVLEKIVRYKKELLRNGKKYF